MDRRELRLTGIAVLLALFIAGALLVTVAPSPAVPSCGGTPGGNTPFGSALALSPPIETSRGPHVWYNFTIESGQGSLAWSELTFQLQTPSAEVVVPGSGWSLSALAQNGSMIASYEWNGTDALTWSSSSSAPVESGQGLSLDTFGTVISGDVWTVFLHWTGPCPFDGVMTESIP